MKILGGVLIGILIFLAFVAVTRAQIPENAHWADPCISHSGDEPLNTWVGSSLTEWGQTSAITDCGAGTEIVITWVDTLFGSVLGRARVSTFPDGRIESCTIQISRILTMDIPDENLYLIVAHEVGHCNGLNHIQPPPQALMNPFCCSWWTQADRDYIASKYPQTGPPTATAVPPTVIATGTVLPPPTVTVVPPPITPTPGVHGEPFFSIWNFPDTVIPDDYGFAAVYQYQEDGSWLRWHSRVPAYVNNLLMLERGNGYWFVPWE